MDPRIIALVVGGVVSIIATMTVAVSFLSVLKFWLTRKRREPVALPGYDPEAIARLQASVDAISIEIERISEGQRFTTRLLNERSLEADRISAGPS